jgi:hypothetical protein
MKGQYIELLEQVKLEEAKATGKAQIALMDRIGNMKKGETLNISDIPFKAMPFKFAQIINAASALGKKGLVDFDGSNMVTIK